MSRSRPVWVRGLRLYRARPDHALAALGRHDEDDSFFDERIHARSRFRSELDPRRFALYSVHDDETLPGPAPTAVADGDHALVGDHTLVVVREFRRVPLHASALGLVLFTARVGHAAQVVATIAHFVERAVSLYQPAYLLLARSLEEPRVSALLMGVQEAAALQAGSPAAFSVATLVDEVQPCLAQEPERYAYWPEPRVELLREVSPYAV